jgi:hypothetical protein
MNGARARPEAPQFARGVALNAHRRQQMLCARICVDKTELTRVLQVVNGMEKPVIVARQSDVEFLICARFKIARRLRSAAGYER